MSKPEPKAFYPAKKHSTKKEEMYKGLLLQMADTFESESIMLHTARTIRKAVAEIEKSNPK